MQIVQARRVARGSFGSSQSGKEQGGQNADNKYRDQQLQKGKRGPRPCEPEVRVPGRSAVNPKGNNRWSFLPIRHRGTTYPVSQIPLPGGRFLANRRAQTLASNRLSL